MTWLYYLGGALSVVAGVVLYVLYRGYNKVKPKPLKGVPYPPFTHSVLGHPEYLFHPAKHELRLQLAENFSDTIFQLVLSNHASVFVSDSGLVRRVFDDLPNKGGMYNMFRLNPAIPDLIASDGSEHELRFDAFQDSLLAMKLPSDCGLVKVLVDILEKHADSGTPLNLFDVSSLFALDAVCISAFGFDLGATQGSEFGKSVYLALRALLAAQQASNPLYKSNSPPSKEIVAEAASIWRQFLNRVLNHIKEDSNEFLSKHGELDETNRVGHALMKLASTAETAGFTYDDACLNSEIHQIIKHGHECIAATLCWSMHALCKNPSVRANLEETLLADNGLLASESLDNFIKEVLRRYPAAGNMTVRTVDQEDYSLMNCQLPMGTAIHLHMHSLQNTNKEWSRPKEFLPDRWKTTAASDEKDEDTWTSARSPTTQQSAGASIQRPRCPFQTRYSNSTSETDFLGCGFEPSKLSYFPFSVGKRACLGREFSIKLFRELIKLIVTHYRLDESDASFNQVEVGVSIHSVILPGYTQSTTMTVTRMTNPGTLPQKRTTNSGGWADDEN